VEGRKSDSRRRGLFRLNETFETVGAEPRVPVASRLSAGMLLAGDKWASILS
jgi:hypothetical protein